jgi:hypothetical protein
MAELITELVVTVVGTNFDEAKNEKLRYIWVVIKDFYRFKLKIPLTIK